MVIDNSRIYDTGLFLLSSFMKIGFKYLEHKRIYRFLVLLIKMRRIWRNLIYLQRTAASLFPGRNGNAAYVDGCV